MNTLVNLKMSTSENIWFIQDLKYIRSTLNIYDGTLLGTFLFWEKIKNAVFTRQLTHFSIKVFVYNWVTNEYIWESSIYIKEYIKSTFNI